MRDLNTEYSDTKDRLYAYNFDYILRDYMVKTLKPFFNLKGTALEMGCYKGEFTKTLAAIFEDVTVLEGSSELIKEAKQNINRAHVNFVGGQFETVQLNARFDNIFLIHTLEHIDDPQLVLKKIKSWLNPGGKFFLVCPNANAASRQIAVHMGLISHNAAVTEGEYKHGHRKTYSLDTLELEAKTSGFRVESRGGVFFKPFANFQFDRMINDGIIGEEYLDACYNLGMIYPDLTASIYVVLSLPDMESRS